MSGNNKTGDVEMATAAGASSPSNDAGADAAAASGRNNSSTTGDQQQQQQQHHNHSHGHQHHHSATCPQNAAARQQRQSSLVQVQLNVPELLNSSGGGDEVSTRKKIVQALFTLVRMGPYEMYEELTTEWRKKKKKEEAGGSSNSASAAAAAMAEIDRAVREARDDRGHSLLHWASKRVDDPRFVKDLSRYVDAGVPTELDGMTPVHWACTESNALPVLKVLLQSSSLSRSASSKPLLEVRDSTGCTPLLIAAQHGQVETAAWLVQMGADRDATDSSRDSAVHWAAYKGSLSVLGMLTHDTGRGGGNSAVVDASRILEQPDAYGQTPLHLAALRGHVDVCRYILRQLLVSPGAAAPASSEQRKRQVLYLLDMPDKNLRTPYGLAVHKQQHRVAHLLDDVRARLTQNRKQQLRGAVVRNARSLVSISAWKEWMGFGSAAIGDDNGAGGTGSADSILTGGTAPQFPFYYVGAHIVANYAFYFSVYLPIFNTSSGLLWDSMLSHILLLALLSFGLYCFYQTYKTDPGKVELNDVQVWRRLYERTLEEYANADTPGHTQNLPQLCHTCHIARPHRSKHDKFSEACVLVFDHHCPFVGTTVGLYNYKWFYFFCLSTWLYLAGQTVMLITYCSRHKRQHSNQPASAGVLAVGIFLSLHGLFALAMWLYHTRLLTENLTTNEALNMHKYRYLWREDVTSSGSHRTFYNPFNRGWATNFAQRLLHPNRESYMLEEQFVGLLNSQHHDSSDIDDDGRQNSSSADKKRGTSSNQYRQAMEV